MRDGSAQGRTEPPRSPGGARRGRRGGAARAGSEGDLQRLVGRALARLLEETGCALGAVWWRDPAGRPAALAGQGPTPAPGADALDALLALPGPTDLGERDSAPPLAGLARATGLSAGCAIGADGAPLAAIVLGGEQDPPGAVRPRTLAALGAAAGRLAPPLSAARGAQRLAALDAGVQRLDRLAALGELVAEIVHEIRNPLVSVKTFLQLLPERADDAEFREKFHEVATDELRRVERLLDLILAHGRPAEPEPPHAGSAVADAFEAVVHLVAHRAAQVGAALDAPSPPGRLRAALGEDALRQVLLNLVLNAIDATPSGGSVRLRACAAEGGVEIRVEDDGDGVPSELRERIFEPFFSTHPDRPGGLGLAISRRLAERAGGRVDVAEGATGCFRVWLPAQDASASHSET